MALLSHGVLSRGVGILDIFTEMHYQYPFTSQDPDVIPPGDSNMAGLPLSVTESISRDALWV